MFKPLKKVVVCFDEMFGKWGVSVIINRRIADSRLFQDRKAALDWGRGQIIK